MNKKKTATRSLHKDTGGQTFHIEHVSWFEGPDIVSDYRQEFRIIGDNGKWKIVTNQRMVMYKIQAMSICHGQNTWQFDMDAWREDIRLCKTRTPEERERHHGVGGWEKHYLTWSEIRAHRANGYEVKVIG